MNFLSRRLFYGAPILVHFYFCVVRLLERLLGSFNEFIWHFIIRLLFPWLKLLWKHWRQEGQFFGLPPFCNPCLKYIQNTLMFCCKVIFTLVFSLNFYLSLILYWRLFHFRGLKTRSLNNFIWKSLCLCHYFRVLSMIVTFLDRVTVHLSSWTGIMCCRLS